MSSNHIVFFTQLYYPDMTTTATIMTDLVEDLADYGMNVEVVCAQPTYIKNLDPQITQITRIRNQLRNSGIEGFRDKNKLRNSGIQGLGNSEIERSGEFPKSECHNEVSIRRVWSFLFDKNKIVGRILNSTSCFLSMLPRLFFVSRNSLLVFNTNPALLPALGLIGAKLRRQGYIVLLHDLWPELPVNIGMIKKGGVLYRIIDFLNKLSFKYACRVVVLSEAMKGLVLSKLPGMDDKIRVIHNWVDQTRVYTVAREDNRLLKDLGLQDKKVVMYSGNLGRYQPLEVMIRAANELRARKDIVFLFAGDGGKKDKIRQLAETMNLDNVMFIPFQSLDSLSESLSMADVSLIGIYPENEGVIMPSKLYGLLAVGKPIICVSDPKSEVVEILNHAGAGLHSSIDDPNELAQKIVLLLDDRDKAQEMGKNGRRYFLEHFERKKITRQWEEVLEAVRAEWPW